MVYYENEKLIIRNMEIADTRVFTDELTAQGIPMKPKYEFSHSKSFGDSLQDTIKSYESGHPVALTVSMD